MNQFSLNSSSLANLSCFFIPTCMLTSVRRVRTQFGGLESQVPVSVSKIRPGTGVPFFEKLDLELQSRYWFFQRTGTSCKNWNQIQDLKDWNQDFFGKSRPGTRTRIFFPCKEPDAKPKETILTCFLEVKPKILRKCQQSPNTGTNY